MVKKNNLIIFFSIFKSNQKIELQSICYGLNIFFPSLILIFYSFWGEYIVAAEIGIVSIIAQTLTQIFSSNVRSIIIYEKNFNLLKSFYFFRLFLAIPILLILYLIIFKNNFLNSIFLFYLSGIIISQWIFELQLLKHEVKKTFKIFYIYSFVSFLFLFTLLIFFIAKLETSYVLLSYLIFLSSYLCYEYIFVSFKKFNYKNLINFFIQSLSSSAFLSSFSITIANLIWRATTIFFCGKILAGIYFSSFAIGSLPGTLFNNTFGPSIIKNKIKLNFFYYYLQFIFFLIALFFLFISIQSGNNIFSDSLSTQFFTIGVSMIGSYFMVKAMISRQKKIQNEKNNNFVFRVDILYALIVAIIVPILYFVGSKILVSLSFLVSSLIAWMIFDIFYEKIKLFFR
jgi:hypothetical protein